MAKLKRAYSPGEIMNMNMPTYEFTGQWQAAIGNPSKNGTWIIWGASGNGKSSFVMQLAKYLCGFGKVIYDSLEEGASLSMQKSLKRHRMDEVRRRLVVLDREPMEMLWARLDKKKSPGIVIIDSFQYSGLSYRDYQQMKERYRNKLLIFISHAEGLRPAGKPAKRVEYDADVKIMVSCFRAMVKSRFLDHPGEPITIWGEGAARANPEEAATDNKEVNKDDGQNGDNGDSDGGRPYYRIRF